MKMHTINSFLILILFQIYNFVLYIVSAWYFEDTIKQPIHKGVVFIFHTRKQKFVVFSPSHKSVFEKIYLILSM